MSKRSERRAAERMAHKANPTKNQSQATAETPLPRLGDQEDLFATLQAGRIRTLEFLAQHPIPESSEPEPSSSPNPAASTNAPGKQTVAQNRRSKGLHSRAILQPDESEGDYLALVDEVYNEYLPATPTECRLAESIIQHYWLMQRAVRLQEINFRVDDKKLALYTRYQTTHERSYYKAQKELQRLKKEAAKEQIGFEQQNQKNENLEARTRLIQAKARSIEIDTACRQVMEAPVPGNTKLSFEELTKACSDAIGALLAGKRQAAAA